MISRKTKAIKPNALHNNINKEFKKTLSVNIDQSINVLKNIDNNTIDPERALFSWVVYPAKESIAAAKPNPNEMLSSKEVIKIFIMVMATRRTRIRMAEVITPDMVQYKRNIFFLSHRLTSEAPSKWRLPLL